MTRLIATASQTVGPYLHIGLAPRYRADVAFDERVDQPRRIVVEGQAFAGDASPLTGGMIEVWQADAHGRYGHPHDPGSSVGEDVRSVAGFGRLPIEEDGRFAFTTVKPGRVAAPDGSLQAPHIVVACFARGLLKHLSTRIYFDDDVDAHAEDFLLSRVPSARRGTLIAKSDGRGRYRWALTTTGSPESETVFFEF